MPPKAFLYVDGRKTEWLYSGWIIEPGVGSTPRNIFHRADGSVQSLGGGMLSHNEAEPFRVDLKSYDEGIREALFRKPRTFWDRLASRLYSSYERNRMGI